MTEDKEQPIISKSNSFEFESSHCKAPTVEDLAENNRSIQKMSTINRFRLMFGLPLFPEEQITKIELNKNEPEN